MSEPVKNILTVDSIDISYGNKQIVHQVSFNLQENDIGCLLGPSGCGKTTILLAIAGFINPTSGEIAINGNAICNTQMVMPPEQRNIGMVFQDYALFPNLNVSDNICFGIKHWPSQQQSERLSQLLDLVSLTELANAYPHQLSGGQQQRVALARAMAPKPSLLLLDEPFSNLDIELREQLAREVRGILREEGISAILVTHDQQEAFAMADDICVMDSGTVQQQASAQVLYHQPGNEFVANFIGEGALLNAQMIDETVSSPIGNLDIKHFNQSELGNDLRLLIRPEVVEIDPNGSLAGRIVDRVFRGSHTLYTIELSDGITLLSLSSTGHYDKDMEVNLTLHTDRIAIVNASSDQSQG